MEAHRYGATLYVAGFLATLAATRAEELVSGLSQETSVVRVDLRAVDLIDPDSFVRIARTLSQWRDRHRGRVTIEFPERSLRRDRSHVKLLDHPVTNGIAVSTAMI